MNYFWMSYISKLQKLSISQKKIELFKVHNTPWPIPGLHGIVLWHESIKAPDYKR